MGIHLPGVPGPPNKNKYLRVGKFFGKLYYPGCQELLLQTTFCLLAKIGTVKPSPNPKEKNLKR
jgi:hypothetical protein